MTTKICNPLDARWRFKHATHLNFVCVLVCFILFVFALQNFIFPLGVDVIAVGLAYVVFFHALGKPAIAIECPHCNGYIETNTPWKCGNPKCQKDNERVDEFPFIYRCQHCGVEQKSFECPHANCGKTIYLTEEKLNTIRATHIKPAENKPAEKMKPQPVQKDLKAEEIAQENEAIRKTEFELRKAKLDLQLKDVKKKLEPDKELTQEEILWKSAQEYLDRNISLPKIAEILKAKNAVIFKDNPSGLEKANFAVDRWAENNLPT